MKICTDTKTIVSLPLFSKYPTFLTGEPPDCAARSAVMGKLLSTSSSIDAESTSVANIGGVSIEKKNVNYIKH